MKTLICGLNSQYIHSSLAPYCLKAACQDAPACGQVQVWESSVNRPVEENAALIAGQAPDVVAICCYIWNRTHVGALVRLLRRALPGAVLALGGPEVSFSAEETLRELDEVDYILRGEGEQSFPRFLSCVQAGEDPRGVPGLCGREPGGAVWATPQVPPPAVPPSPLDAGYLRGLNGRIAYLETSRGCPFSCAFCLSGREETARFFPLERAKRELLALAQSGTKTVKLVDRTFNCNKARSDALFAFLMEEYGRAVPPGVCFHFEVAADLFDQQTLDLLAKAPAGLFQLEAGLQSFYGPALEAVTRKTDLVRLTHNLRALLSGNHIHVHIDLIAGLPGEDLEEFGRSFDRAFALRPHMLQLGFLKLLYGSRLRREAQLHGCRFDPAPPYEIQSNRWLSPQDLDRLHRAESALDRVYNSGRFRRTVELLLSAGTRPFDLFCAMGEGLSAPAGASLDAVTESLWRWGSGLPGVNPGALRDAMVCDRLAGDNTGRIPGCLRRGDSRLGAQKRAVWRMEPYASRSGVKAGVAILYEGGERLAVADYGGKHPVLGAYPLRELPLQEV